MLERSARRVLHLVPVLFGVALGTFLLVQLTPGDPARAMLGERATEEQVTRLRARLGLDRPLPVQFGRYLQRVVLRADLGDSITSGRPVVSELLDRFPATMELAVAAMVLAVPAGLCLGLLASLRPGGVLDLSVMGVSLVGVSMPVFWLGLMMILTLGEVLPFDGRLSTRTVFEGPTGLHILDSLWLGRPEVLADALAHLILPAVTLATIPLGLVARMTRSSMVEELSGDYIRTARAKGLSEWAVLPKHALKNAFIPVLTVLGLQFGSLLGGAVLTETIFSWPGMGRYVVEAVKARDLPAVQGGVLVMATIFVVVNLIVDMAYTLFDPRVKG